MTVFTYSANPPGQLLVEPYDIQSPTQRFSRAGVSLLRIPVDKKAFDKAEYLVLLETASNGSLYERQLSTGQLEERINAVPLHRNWDMEIAQIDQEGIKTMSNEREKKSNDIVDMRKTYACKSSERRVRTLRSV